MLWLVSGGRGVAFVPATSARLGIPGVEFLTINGLPPEPVELHLLWGRETRNPAAALSLGASQITRPFTL